MSDLITQEPEVTNSLTAAIENPELVFSDKGNFVALERHIDAEIKAFKPDTSTDKGRKAIKSFAHKITRTKTAIKGVVDEANAELRQNIADNKERFEDIAERLDKRSVKAREPLTKWEEQEADRQKRVTSLKTQLKIAGQMLVTDTSVSIEQRLAEIKAIDLDGEDLRDDFDDITALRDEVVKNLKIAYLRLKEQEDERAELEAEKARIAEERAELEAFRAEKAKREAEVKAKNELSAEQEAPAPAPAPASADDRDEPSPENVEVAKPIARADTAEPQPKQEQPAPFAKDIQIRRDEAIRAISIKTQIDLEAAELVVDHIIRGEIPHIRLEA
jgi:hypothetical protein